jgi:hypothetical protein
MEEFKIIKTWEYRNRKCLILWVRTHYCGYAETSLRDMDADINVHGGITFSGRHDKLPENPFDLDIWYYGFDCAHYDDFLDYKKLGVKMPDFLEEGRHKWTEEEVVKETEHLVDGILEFELKRELELSQTKLNVSNFKDVKIKEMKIHESFITVDAIYDGYKYSGLLLKNEEDGDK